MTTENLVDDLPIRTDVPLNMYPEFIDVVREALDQEGTAGVAALAAGREALRLAYITFGQIEDAVKALPYSKDVRMVGGVKKAMPDPQAVENLIAAAKKSSDRVLPELDRRHAELVRYRDAMNTRVAEALDYLKRKTPEGLAISSEVRAHVKAMDFQKRNEFLSAAIKAGDKEAIAPVLNAPGYLSGMDKESWENLRSKAALVFAPVDAAQAAAVERIIGMVRESGARLVDRFSDVRAMAAPSKGANTRKKIAALAEGGR